MSTKRMLVSILVVAGMLILMLSAVVLAQADQPYAAEPTTLTGGQYTLTGMELSPFQDSTWRVSGEASGGIYRLSILTMTASSASGCCCTYLPCITRISQP